MGDDQTNPEAEVQAAQAQASAEQAQAVKDAAKDTKAEAKAQGAKPVLDTNPVLVGDARNGQPVLVNDPSQRDTPATIETVDDPTRLLDGQGREVQKLG